MKKVNLAPSQMAELERAARRDPDGHVRSRALAVRAVAHGSTRKDVAKILPYSAYTIGVWVRQFEEHGLEGFSIHDGRGRPSRVDDEEVRSCLRLSPQRYGLPETRWTLRALGQACPSLAGMTEQGILNVLHRLGFRYKRGQPWVHSPDPLYTEKKTPSSKRTPRPGKTAQR
jgi:transposase